MQERSRCSVKGFFDHDWGRTQPRAAPADPGRGAHPLPCGANAVPRDICQVFIFLPHFSGPFCLPLFGCITSVETTLGP